MIGHRQSQMCPLTVSVFRRGVIIVHYKFLHSNSSNLLRIK